MSARSAPVATRPPPRPRSAALVRREPIAADRIPYTALLSDTVVATRNGDAVFTFALEGAAFETADDVTLNAWHEQLNSLLRNIASPDVALWSHIVRRRDSSMPPADYPSAFARDLAGRYRERLAGTRLLANDLYLSVVYRARGAATPWLAQLLGRHDAAAVAQSRADALEACGKLQQQLTAALARYGARLLGMRTTRGRMRSELLGFLALLVNGEEQPMPLPRASIAEVLATSRPVFGIEAIEYRAPTRTRLAAMLGIKEYPTPSSPDMFHALLTAPFPFVLTQSFAFLAKPTAQGLLQAQRNRMRNAGDAARSQAVDLEEALDELSGNALVLGDHHVSLQVLDDAADGVAEPHPQQRLRALNDALAGAREMLADTGMVVAREDLALEAAYWAQLPGAFALRPRRAPITSRNFAAMSALHNFPRGRASNNHWGEAAALLTTRAGSPYFFSLHAQDADAASDVGHTFVCGPTGSGKTVLLGFLIAMYTRLGATQVVLDKDRGLEILVRALGGAYLPLRSGVATGFNPLLLPETAANHSFLREWLAQLVAQPGTSLTARQSADLEQALRGALALPPESRRLSRVLEHLDPTDPEGLHARLVRWCAVAGGELAWVFDNPVDELVPLLGSATLAGVDVTEFLDHARVRTPVTMYLLHVIRQLLDGRRFICWADEFWRLLDDPAFAAFSREGPKTWRKANGVFVACTQSPADVLASPIARTIVEQTATKIFFPNPEARADDHIEGFGLTEREHHLVRTGLDAAARQFLVRQGTSSVVCALDLAGFDAELAIISGRLASVRRLDALIATRGPDPAAWLPEFIRLAASAASPSEYDR